MSTKIDSMVGVILYVKLLRICEFRDNRSVPRNRMIRQ